MASKKNLDIETKLVCTICIEKFRPPIYQCETGHTICQNCLFQLETCPYCQSSMSRKIRNYFLEDLCVDLKYPCKFEKSGCKETLYLQKIEVHENVCTFRNFQCPVDQCTFENNKMKLIEHITTLHKVAILKPILKEDFFNLDDVHGKMRFILVKTELFQICYVNKRLHVHSFNSNQENSYTLRLYYKDEDVRRNVAVSEFCVNFDEECWLRHNIDISNFENVFRPLISMQSSCVDLKIETKLLGNIRNSDDENAVESATITSIMPNSSPLNGFNFSNELRSSVVPLRDELRRSPFNDFSQLLSSPQRVVQQILPLRGSSLPRGSSSPRGSSLMGTYSYGARR